MASEAPSAKQLRAAREREIAEKEKRRAAKAAKKQSRGPSGSPIVTTTPKHGAKVPRLATGSHQMPNSWRSTKMFRDGDVDTDLATSGFEFEIQRKDLEVLKERLRDAIKEQDEVRSNVDHLKEWQFSVEEVEKSLRSPSGESTHDPRRIRVMVAASQNLHAQNKVTADAEADESESETGV